MNLLRNPGTFRNLISVFGIVLAGCQLEVPETAEGEPAVASGERSSHEDASPTRAAEPAEDVKAALDSLPNAELVPWDEKTALGLVALSLACVDRPHKQSRRRGYLLRVELCPADGLRKRPCLLRLLGLAFGGQLNLDDGEGSERVPRITYRETHPGETEPSSLGKRACRASSPFLKNGRARASSGRSDGPGSSGSPPSFKTGRMKTAKSGPRT